MEGRPPVVSLLTRAAIPFGAVFFFVGFWVHRATRFADFRVLRLGGELIGAGRHAEAYDVEAFASIAQSRPDMAASHRELDVFLSTPVFGWAMRPFAALTFDPALLLWTLLGLGAVVAAARLLELPAWVAPAAIVMPFGVANLHHGQTGFFALLLAAGIHRLCVDDRKIWAGLAAGLVILKPTLLVGVAIWWLLDWRRWYPAMLAAIPSAGILMLPSLVLNGFEPWTLFLESARNRVDVQANVVANKPTLRELAKRLLGGEAGSSTALLIVILGLGALMMWWVKRTWPERIDIQSSAAIFISILVSPHLYIYDSGLILIPLAVAVSTGIRATKVERLVAIFTVSSLATIMSFGPFGLINDWIAPGAVGMVALFALWVRHLLSTSASTEAHVDQRSIPSSVPVVNVTSSN
ncbi:MAG: glycosyltransferase family 87 protein [Acidimicrobiia bacterium]|nr:glycosyltransferase family 87 protein [Acidimicrobiia bacterium]